MSPKTTNLTPTPEFFDFERLDVYMLSLEHLELVTRVRATAKVRDQLDRASESIMLNIAEGTGKPIRSRDRRRFFRKWGTLTLSSIGECPPFPPPIS